jgi:hypothetical protein
MIVFIHGLNDFLAEARLANLNISASVGYENICDMKTVAFILFLIAREARGMISPALFPTIVAPMMRFFFPRTILRNPSVSLSA